MGYCRSRLKCRAGNPLVGAKFYWRCLELVDKCWVMVALP